MRAKCSRQTDVKGSIYNTIDFAISARNNIVLK